MIEIVALSDAMREAVGLAERVAPTNANVLITGESGSGKDALAAFISLPELGTRLGCAIAGVIPPAAELCTSAAKVGTQLVLLEPDSIAATNLIDMVGKLTRTQTTAAMGV